MRGAVRLRASVPGGSVFLVEGTHEEPANVLTEAVVEVQKVGLTLVPEFVPAETEEDAGA